MEKPLIVKGGVFEDKRGKLRFVNDFVMDDVKRFYIMYHSNQEIVRAWHGHKFEKKYFYVLSGSFIVNSVKIDDWQNPSEDLVPYQHVLDSKESQILCVPSGYANGMKALTPNASMMIMSNFSVEESLGDDYRFDKKLWFNWDNV